MAMNRSEAAHAGWEGRWERAWDRGDEASLGPKGQAYLSEKYGEEIPGEDIPEDEYFEEYNEYEYDMEY